MIKVVEVKTRKQKIDFVDFPTKLYKNNPYYVPPLRIDELNLFNPKKNVSAEECDIKFFLAYKDGKVAGRIAGIIQKAYNEKTQEKRVRFSRFDSIDDQKVATALFKAVEDHAKEMGMEIIHGPIGFNDLDREALLIEGFDQLSTFEEQYNYEYYQRLIENAGYEKEVDYLEYKIFPMKEKDERIDRLAEMAMKRNNLRIATAKNKNDYIKKYAEGIFNVIDEAYSPLYGTVPFSAKVRDDIIASFKMFLNLRYFITVIDENDKVVAFGFAIPSVSKVMQQTKGKIIHPKIFNIIKAVRKPRIIDLALTGILPEYRRKGVDAIILRHMVNILQNDGIEYLETNLNLEDNSLIQNQWKNFPNVNHKRRRCFIKKL